MMRLLISIIIIALLAFALTCVLPWWVLAPVAFTVAFGGGLSAGRGFLAGFLGVGLMWLTVAVVRDQANEHILSARMARLFHLPGYWLFLFAGALVGGLVGGLAGWSGAVVRRVFASRDRRVPGR